MALTPVEIRHVKLGRRVAGYGREETDRLLEDIAESFEDVWRDRADMSDKIEKLEADLVRYKETEHLLRTTLVSAEQAAAEQKAQAKREADVILQEAHAEARAITRQALAESERLQSEARRARGLLQSALMALEPEAEAPVRVSGPGEGVRGNREAPPWPTRAQGEDTGEIAVGAA